MVEESAVFYRQEDYLGVMRRLLIDLVDTLVAGAAALLLIVVALLIYPTDEHVAAVVLAMAGITWLCYFVLLKGSRFRTLGYMIARAQIVNLNGERPSYASLTGRLMFVVAGPFNFILDLLWIGSDSCRQALRDKFAHTFVVRRGAVPAGKGRVVYRTYTVFGATLLFAEVVPDDPGAT